MGEAAEARDGFRSRGGFIVSCIGSAVGLGNIWRFPVMVSLWGGLTFIIPFLVFVALIAATGVIAEFALGRAARAGPYGAFGLCTYLRWGRRGPGRKVGVIPILGGLALAIGYTCVMAWILKYTYLALTGDLAAMGDDLDAISGLFDSTASAWGASGWVVLAILLTLAILAMGVGKGIERANKVMMPLLFVMFAALAVYVSTLPGASAGYSYILTVDTDLLSNPMLWVFAFGQAFFSMSVAGNGSVIYGSYLSRRDPIPSSAAIVALFNVVSAILVAMVVIPAMAAAGGDLSSGGPGLLFIYLVEMFNGMSGGYVVGAVFFVCVLFAGLSSIINLYEAPVSFLSERFGLGRVKAAVCMLAIGCVCALCIQAVVSEWMDVVSIYICPLGALLAGVMFFWIAGRDFAEDEASRGSRRRIGRWFYPSGKYVYCTLAAVALIAGALCGGIGRSQPLLHDYALVLEGPVGPVRLPVSARTVCGERGGVAHVDIHEHRAQPLCPRGLLGVGEDRRA